MFCNSGNAVCDQSYRCGSSVRGTALAQQQVISSTPLDGGRAQRSGHENPLISKFIIGASPIVESSADGTGPEAKCSESNDECSNVGMTSRPGKEFDYVQMIGSLNPVVRMYTVP
jgi:hypothetical protein